MRTFGVLTQGSHISQQTTLIFNSLNNLVREYSDISPIVFYQEYGPFPIKPEFALMQELEAWAFEGALISTSLTTTQTLLKCPRATPKFFYLWDLEWLYIPQLFFKPMSDIYNNPDIELIARSKSHAKIIENCWRKPLAIVEDFTHVELEKLI